VSYLVRRRRRRASARKHARGQFRRLWGGEYNKYKLVVIEIEGDANRCGVSYLVRPRRWRESARKHARGRFRRFFWGGEYNKYKLVVIEIEGDANRCGVSYLARPRRWRESARKHARGRFRRFRWPSPLRFCEEIPHPLGREPSWEVWIPNQISGGGTGESNTTVGSATPPDALTLRVRVCV